MRKQNFPLGRSVLYALFFLLLGFKSFAQKEVIGKIVNGKDNSPVVGATVTVKDTKIATQTSLDGTFKISVPNDKSILVVTAVGFESMQLSTSGRSSLDAALKETSTSLNEIVVTGYTAQKKKDITGSVAVINVKDLKQAPVGTGEEALQGRASGLTVVSSGQPGGGSDIRIRGITSFGDNTPLVIIDGIQGSIHDINVNDVESIQVLKDASAAIYGVRASNGVIIVTTKKGKSGRAKVAYDSYYGIVTPGKGFDMANTQEKANSVWLQQLNSNPNVTPTDVQYGTGATPVIPDFITPAGVSGAGPDPSTYDINSNQITRANKIGTNWYKVITRNAPKQSHNISVSSGSDKSSYFFSLGYLNEQGIAKFQYNKRYSVRANTQFAIGDHIRVGENAYIYYKQNPQYGNQGEGSPFSTVFREDPIIPVYDIMGNFAGTKSQGLGNARNPYADIYRTKDNIGHNWVVNGNVFAEADILKHFTVRTSFGGNISNSFGYAFNYVGYENAEGNTGSNSFSQSASFYTDWTYTNTVKYSNKFGDHTITALAGTEAFYRTNRDIGAGRSDYFSEDPNFWILSTGAGAQSNTGFAEKRSLWSYIGRIEYAFADKYLLNVNIRRDGSSLFLKDVRFGNFPAISVAWRVSQEDFMKGVSFVNDLKFRYSWAKLGNYAAVQPTNGYDLYASRFGKSFYDISGTSTSPAAGFFQSNIKNESTSWERDIISNVGFDATLFDNKVDITLDWYKKKISGLLFGAQGVNWDPIFVGNGQRPQVNIGDMQNTGIDFNATYHGSISKDLKFDVTAMITSYNNKIVDIPGLPYFNGPQVRNVIIQRNMEGQPLGTYFGYKVLGLFKDADDVAKSPTQVDASPGVFKYEDVNKDGKIDDNDRTIIGDPNPDFTYGLNLSLNYKALDFSAFFFGSQGNDIFNQTLYYTDFPDFFKGGIRREAAINSWTPTNPNATVPKLRTVGGFSTDGVTNSYFVSSGSYFRCRQIQIGYTLPASLSKKAGIDRLRVYAQGANLFTITKYNGLDPELIGGIDLANYPHTPAFLFGVNLAF